MSKLIPILILVFLSFGCERYDFSYPIGESVDFYRLSNYKTLPNSRKIIDSTVKISDIKIISYNDILSYNKKTFSFKLSDKTSDYISDWEHNQLYGTAFAVTVDDSVIYTGYFWAGFSSTGCDWVTTDIIDYSNDNNLTINLGYPGLMLGDNIPDKRNDKKILDVFKNDNKLIDK